MLILAIHSSSPSLGVALLDGIAPQAEIILPPGKRHQENLAGLIRQVLAEAGKIPGQIQAIVAAKGPGSFSGVRVGLAMAKGMAMGLGKPLIGVSSLESLAWSGLVSNQTGIAIIDAKRDEVYAAVYRKTEHSLDEARAPALMSKEEIHGLFAQYPDITKMVGDPVIHQIENLPDASSTLEAQVLGPSPMACAQLGAHKLLKGQGDELHSLIPLYIRKSDAELKAR